VYADVPELFVFRYNPSYGAEPVAQPFEEYRGFTSGFTDGVVYVLRVGGDAGEVGDTPSCTREIGERPGSQS
jgi:hypothetical protein